MLFAAVITVMFLTGFQCRKSDPLASRESLLTGGPWHYANTMLKYDDGTEDLGPADICKQDDTYTYEVNGDVTVQYGPNDCGVVGVDGKYATWELSADYKSLTEVYTREMFGIPAGSTVVYGIKVLTDYQMIIFRTVTESGKTFEEYTYYSR